MVEDDDWLIVVPFWAIWPFETLVIPKRPVERLQDLAGPARDSLAGVLIELLGRYDNLFRLPFPYSMGWHQAPFNGQHNAHWQLHGHLFPPLQRAAVRKFIAGYEMFAETQRDLSAEEAAERLRTVSASPLPEQCGRRPLTDTTEPAELAPGCSRSSRARATGQRSIQLVRAPGRVNLIGEYTDFNLGYVLPAAIDREIRLAFVPTADRRVVLHRLDTGETRRVRPRRACPTGRAAGSTTRSGPPGPWPKPVCRLSWTAGRDRVQPAGRRRPVLIGRDRAGGRPRPAGRAGRRPTR